MHWSANSANGPLHSLQKNLPSINMSKPCARNLHVDFSLIENVNSQAFRLRRNAYPRAREECGNQDRELPFRERLFSQLSFLQTTTTKSMIHTSAKNDRKQSRWDRLRAYKTKRMNGGIPRLNPRDGLIGFEWAQLVMMQRGRPKPARRITWNKREKLSRIGREM